MAKKARRKRLATEAEKKKARQSGQPVPTYVYADTGTPFAGYDSGGSSYCSTDSSSSSSSGGGCDSGSSF